MRCFSLSICTLLTDCSQSESHVKVLTGLSQNVLITPRLLSTAVRSFASKVMGSLIKHHLPTLLINSLCYIIVLTSECGNDCSKSTLCFLFLF